MNALGNKRIIRTKDVYSGSVKKPEIEDILRDTLVEVGKSVLGWDVAKQAKQQATRPIVDVFADGIADFSKYKLAKAYLKWTQTNDASKLTPDERTSWESLINRINAALK